jgi:hypothetical protein
MVFGQAQGTRKGLHQQVPRRAAYSVSRIHGPDRRNAFLALLPTRGSGELRQVARSCVGLAQPVVDRRVYAGRMMKATLVRAGVFLAGVTGLLALLGGAAQAYVGQQHCEPVRRG